MWDIVSKGLALLLPSFLRFALRPLRVELHSLYYDLVKNDPGVLVYFVTAYPQRYFCEVSLTNRSTSPAYVKEVCLEIPKRVFRETQNIRLEPGERKAIRIVFPVDTEGEPDVEGAYVLTVTPTIGRSSRATGTFPVGE